MPGSDIPIDSTIVRIDSGHPIDAEYVAVNETSSAVRGQTPPLATVSGGSPPLISVVGGLDVLATSVGGGPIETGS